MTDRMAVEEIYESVDSQCHLTFDYLLFCFAAAMIAGAFHGSTAVCAACPCATLNAQTLRAHASQQASG